MRLWKRQNRLAPGTIAMCSRTPGWPAASWSRCRSSSGFGNGSRWTLSTTSITARSQESTDMGDFARRVVVAVLITVLILAVAYFLWRGVHVLLEAFAGVLFAVFLGALSDWLSKQT